MIKELECSPTNILVMSLSSVNGCYFEAIVHVPRLCVPGLFGVRKFALGAAHPCLTYILFDWGPGTPQTASVGTAVIAAALDHLA